jgi:hypothetical protein
MATPATLESSILNSTTDTPRRLLRRTGAVFAGLAAIFALTTAIEIVLHRTDVFPPVGASGMSHPLLLLALSYRLVFDVFGCYLTGRLAPTRPMFHAMVLGAIGLCLSTVGAIAMWDPEFAWYPIALAASALPSGWLGGRLAERAANSIP